MPILWCLAVQSLGHFRCKISTVCCFQSSKERLSLKDSKMFQVLYFRCSSASHHDFRSNAQPSTQILIGMYLWGSHPRPGEEEEKMVVAEKKNWCNFCSEFTMDPMWRILRRNFGYNAWNASFSHCVGHYGLPTKNHPTYYTYFWPPLPSLNTLAIKKTLWLKNEGTY